MSALVWEMRTLADVRTGDFLRLAGQQARVLHADHSVWHVGNKGSGAWWDDVPLEHPQALVRLERDGQERAYRFIDLSVPVEILVSAEELAVIGLLGWENRISCYLDSQSAEA